MGIQNPIRQGLAVAVILLFIGVAVAPSINASVVKDELVEFDVEFCGLGKKHTVKLTRQEADEVDLLFDEIEERLSEVETRGEAEIIFKDAVVEFDKYGFLGDLSVRQSQKLVIGEYLLTANNFCLITGQITNADFFNLPFFIIFLIDMFIGFGLAELWHSFASFFQDIIPLKMFSTISIGHYRYYLAGPNTYYPSEGRIWTCGINGIKEWDGTLTGTIHEIHLLNPYISTVHEVGIKGFLGIQIKNSLTDVTSLLGIGRKVDIKYSDW